MVIVSYTELLKICTKIKRLLLANQQIAVHRERETWNISCSLILVVQLYNIMGSETKHQLTIQVCKLWFTTYKK